MKVKEYMQIGTSIATETIIVDEQEETVMREVPIMGWVERESTQQEIDGVLQAENERIKNESNRAPTAEERIEAQVIYSAMMTGTLLMEE